MKLVNEFYDLQKTERARNNEHFSFINFIQITMGEEKSSGVGQSQPPALFRLTSEWKF